MSEKVYDMPYLTRRGIDDYVERRRPAGNFLEAVLSNDLTNAINRADNENRKALVEIVRYCYWEIPHRCWGSPAKYAAWLEGGEREDNQS